MLLLQDIAENLFTCQEVVDEIKNKRQLKRLAVLPYDLQIKYVETESIQIVTNFAKKTGDYPSLSATDIKVLALTYQLEKEKNGVAHLRSEPIVQKSINLINRSAAPVVNADIAGFYMPQKGRQIIGSVSEDSKSDLENMNTTENTQDKLKASENSEEGRKDDATVNVETRKEEKKDDTASNVEVLDVNEIFDKDSDNKLDSSKPSDEDDELELDKELVEKLEQITIENVDDILVSVKHNSNEASYEDSSDCQESDENEHGDDSEASYASEDSDDDFGDDKGWITPSNLKAAQKSIGGECLEDKQVTVSCMTTDFAMQNVLKQMNLNVCALDGRVIKHLRTFILRCYTCFKTTSLMEKLFCPNCGHKTLKKVAVSLDDDGKLQIHINVRRPLTGKGKKFSMPKFKGGKHSNNPIIVEDQPLPHNRPSKLARQKNDPLHDDYIAGSY